MRQIDSHDDNGEATVNGSLTVLTQPTPCNGAAKSQAAGSFDSVNSSLTGTKTAAAFSA